MLWSGRYRRIRQQGLDRNRETNISTETDQLSCPSQEENAGHKHHQHEDTIWVFSRDGENLEVAVADQGAADESVPSLLLGREVLCTRVVIIYEYMGLAADSKSFH